MDASFTSYVSQPSVIIQLLAGTAAIAAVAFGGAMAIPKFTQKLIPNPKATRLGDHIKFIRMHKNRRTIIGEDGVHTVVLSARGTDLRFNDAGTQQGLANARQSWIEQMSDLGIRTRIYLMRDRLPRAANYKNNHGIMREVSDTWNKNLPLALSTEYYIALSVKDATKGVQRLDEAIEQTKAILADYHVAELTDEYEVAERVEDGVLLDELREHKLTPGAFFGRMLAPNSRPNPIGERRGRQLSYELTTDNVRYDPDLGMLEFSDGPTKKYAAVFVIEEWSSPMYESHMLELLSYPFEMTICHDVAPISKGTALGSLRWQEKMAPGLSPGSDAAEQYSTVAMAIERGSEEEQELCNVQTMITIYGNTPEEVLRGRAIINQLKQIGITPIWPKHTMVQHWFGHFPGFDAQSRPQRILSGEVSLLSTFQYTPAGEQRSDWGDGPIAMFETLDGSPYAFQFHAPGGGSPPLGHCVSIGPSGAGKAQPLDAKILTPTGWSTMGEMAVGKTVRTPDGKVAKVTGLFPQGELMSYEVEFSDGRKVESCEDHLWKIWNPMAARYEVQTLKEVQALLKAANAKGRNISVPLMAMDAAEFAEQKFAIQPYALGAILGDGTTRCGGLRFSTIEPEHFIDKIEEGVGGIVMRKVAGSNCDYAAVMVDADASELQGDQQPISQTLLAYDGKSQTLKAWSLETGIDVERLSHRVRIGYTPAQVLGHEAPARGDARTVQYKGQAHTIAELADKSGLYPQIIRSRLAFGWSVEQAIGDQDRPDRHWRSAPVVAELKRLGIYGLDSQGKYIPDDYMQGSVAQRLELLRGLLDTDGSVSKQSAEFTSVSKRLAQQVQQLAWSLGATASISSRQTSYTATDGTKALGKTSWRVLIAGANIADFFSLPRKAEAVSDRQTEARLHIRSVTPVGVKSMQCIAIDHPDHLYVTNDYVVTHNTTLITFLASMALRHEGLKTFFFDRGRGCEVVTKALGGSYLFFGGEEGEANTALNPMQIENTVANRQFLREWLELIADVDEKEYHLSEQISDAVEINFDPEIPVMQRNLRKLYYSVFPPDSPLRERMLNWTNPNMYGPIICAERDALDIEQRVAGFDFTNILTDPKLGPAMVSYLMHRILVEARGDPRLIFIDETEPLLRNQNFQLRYRKLLQEGRKERQVIISCFQRPTAPEELGLGDVIRGQCPTVFFFRNPQAEEKDYADWRLTKRELDFVLGKSYRKNKYAVLLKRYVENEESILLNTDLSSLGRLMNIYHSGRKNVLLLNEMQKQHGADFLAHYLQTA